MPCCNADLQGTVVSAEDIERNIKSSYDESIAAFLRIQEEMMTTVSGVFLFSRFGLSYSFDIF